MLSYMFVLWLAIKHEPLSTFYRLLLTFSIFVSQKKREGYNEIS